MTPAVGVQITPSLCSRSVFAVVQLAFGAKETERSLLRLVSQVQLAQQTFFHQKALLFWLWKWLIEPQMLDVDLWIISLKLEIQIRYQT